MSEASCLRALQQQDWKTLAKESAKMIRNNPESFNGCLFYGLAAMNLEMYEQSEKSLRRAIELHENLPEPWKGLNELYKRIPNVPEKQIEVLEQLIIVNPEKKLEYYLRLGELYETTNCFEKAILNYERFAEHQIDLKQKYDILSKIFELSEAKCNKSDPTTLGKLIEIEKQMIANAPKETNHILPFHERNIRDLVNKRKQSTTEKAEIGKQVIKVCKETLSFTNSIVAIEETLIIYEEEYLENEKTIREVFERCVRSFPSHFLSKAIDALSLIDKVDFSKTHSLYKLNCDKENRKVIDSFFYSLEQYISEKARPILLIYVNLANMYLLDAEYQKAKMVIEKGENEIKKRSIESGNSFTVFRESLLFIKLRLLIALEEYSEAEKGLTDFWNAKQYGSVGLILIDIFHSFGKLSEAEQIIHALNDKLNHCIEIKERNAIHLIKLGQYTEAKKILLECSRERPESLSLWALISKAFCEMGGEYLTDRRYTYNAAFKAAEIGSRNTEPLIASKVPFDFTVPLKDFETLDAARFLSIAYYCLGKYLLEVEKSDEKAMEFFLKAVKMDPYDEETALCLINLYEKKKIKKVDSLISDIITATSQRKRQPGWAWSMLAKSLRNRLTPDHDTIIKVLLKAIASDLSRASYWEALGNEYFDMKLFESALKAFEKTNNLDSSKVSAQYYRGLIHILVGENIKALSVFEKAYNDIKAQPKKRPKQWTMLNYPILFGYATALFANSKNALKECSYSIAEELCNQGLEFVDELLDVSFAQNNVSTWKLAGDFLFFSLHFHTDLSNSHKCLEKIIERYSKVVLLLQKEKKKKHELELSTKCDIAFCEFLLRKNENGIQRLKHLLSEAQNAKIWNVLGMLYMESSPYKSFHCFATAITIDKKFSPAWNNLCLLCLLYNDNNNAWLSAKTSLDIDEHLLSSWIKKGIVYERSGEDNLVKAYESYVLARECPDVNSDWGLGITHTSLTLLRLLRTDSFRAKEDINPHHLMHNIDEGLASLSPLHRELFLSTSSIYAVYLELIGNISGALDELDRVEKNSIKESNLLNHFYSAYNKARLLLLQKNYHSSLSSIEEAKKSLQLLKNLLDETTFDLFNSRLSVLAILCKASSGNSLSEVETYYSKEFDSEKSRKVFTLSEFANVNLLFSSVFLQSGDLNAASRFVEKSLLFDSHKPQLCTRVLALQNNGTRETSNIEKLSQSNQLESTKIATDYVITALEKASNGDYEKANLAFSKAIHQTPTNASVWYSYLQFLVTGLLPHTNLESKAFSVIQNKTKEALENCDDTVGKKILKGVFYASLKEVEQAHTIFSNLVISFPSIPFFWLLLLKLYEFKSVFKSELAMNPSRWWWNSVTELMDIQREITSMPEERKNNNSDFAITFASDCCALLASKIKHSALCLGISTAAKSVMEKTSSPNLQVFSLRLSVLLNSVAYTILDVVQVLRFAVRQKSNNRIWLELSAIYSSLGLDEPASVCRSEVSQNDILCAYDISSFVDSLFL